MRALEIAILRQDPLRRAAALKLLGTSLRLSGRSREALEPIRGALQICANASDALLEAELLHEAGVAHAECGDHAAAREMWTTALSAFERIGAQVQAQRVRSVMESQPQA